MLNYDCDIIFVQNPVKTCVFFISTKYLPLQRCLVCLSDKEHNKIVLIYTLVFLINFYWYPFYTMKHFKNVQSISNSSKANVYLFHLVNILVLDVKKREFRLKFSSSTYLFHLSSLYKSNLSHISFVQTK